MNNINKDLDFFKNYLQNWISNQFILDLKKNIRRWLDSKYLKWIRPTRVPVWYLNSLNEFSEKVITIDKERFIYIKWMWDLMLTWNYKISQINDILDKFWFKTRKTAKMWWKKLTNTWIYRIFNNVFYTWHYYYNWKLIKWVHKPFITLEEFDEMQILLWKN